MIFGGLEIAAGGYLLHRHYRHKNEKKRQADEAEARRYNTFPGAKSAHPQRHFQQPVQHQRCFQQPAPLHFQQHPQPYQQPVPQQKYAYYAPTTPQPHCHQTPVHTQPVRPRPQPPRHMQTFNIPRRPVPDRTPQIIFEPSLQRSDSFATLSRMPIANGSRSQTNAGMAAPSPPPRQSTNGLQPGGQHGIYGTAGFSVSTPAFGATPTSPGLTYAMATEAEAHAMHTTDDNWEIYGRRDNMVSYAPLPPGDLAERDPPPPYSP